MTRHDYFESRKSTLVDVARGHARSRPDDEVYRFLLDGEEKQQALTFSDLDHRARTIAAALQDASATGERVVLIFTPGLEFVAAFLGCLYAGAVAVPTYPPRSRRRDARLDGIVRDAGPRFVLTTSALASRLTSGGPCNGLRALCVDELDDDLAADWREPAVGSDDLAFLQYTSGSTASPKGVCVTHDSLLANQRAIRDAFRQSRESVIVGWLPLYHDMGLIGNVLQPLYTGACCVLLAPVAFIKKPVRWLRAISRFRATTSGGPNFAYDLCVRRVADEDLARIDLSSWEVAFNGAETVRADTLERFATRFATYGFRRRAFFPCYGLAEATLFVAGGPGGAGPRVRPFAREALERDRAETPAETDSVAELVSCGLPADGQRIEIVDPSTLWPLPDGRVGEIWVAGDGVAPGYWRLPTATRDLFQARLGNGEGPFLRTGDLGFLHGGELFVTGRRKDLIIIHGRNLYPQDVERLAEAGDPALRTEGAVAFSVVVDGEERLVVVCEVERREESRAGAAEEAVRRRIAEELEVPVYEVVLVRAGSVPRTSSGKVRRSSCRDAYLHDRLHVLRHLRRPSASMDRPQSPVVDAGSVLGLPEEEAQATVLQALVAWVADRLEVETARIDPEASLTAMGLDSLAAMELKGSIEEALKVTLPADLLVEAGSLESLSGEIVANLGRTDGSAVESPVAASGSPAEVPLSHNQRSLWFVEWMSPDRTANVIQAAARVRGELDPDRLRRALERVIARHPSLRSTFVARDGEPVQIVAKTCVPDLRVVEAGGWTHAELRDALEAEASRPFDLAAGPLLRLRLYRRFDGESVALLVVHHLVVDFWSLAIVLRELDIAYRADSEVPLPPPPRFRYADFSLWQQRLLEGAEGARLWKHWLGEMAGERAELELPTDRPRPHVRTARGSSRPLRLGPDGARALGRLARRAGVTPFVCCLAAFGALLRRYSGQSDLSIGTLTAGRSRAAFHEVVGYFVNPVVLRTSVADRSEFLGLLEQYRDTVHGALRHQELPFTLLTERLRPVRDPSRTPLVEAAIVWQKAQPWGTGELSSFALGEDGTHFELAGARFESLALRRRPVQFDLFLMLAETSDGVAGSLQYNVDLFDPTTIARMAGHFGALLKAACVDPSRRLAELPMCSLAEAHQLIREENDSGSGVRPTALLHELVSRWATMNPDAVALVDGDERMTYGGLVRAARRVRDLLRQRGVATESRVAICLDRSLAQVVAALGTLMAGGAYLPIDSRYPEDRIAHLLTDGRAVVLITDPALVDALPPTRLPVLFVDGAPALEPAATAELPPVFRDSVAYVIYTSGSTGRPKGVEVTHANAVHLVEVAAAAIDLPGSEVWTLFHSLAFDFSVWELWVPLARGATLVVVSEDRTRSPERFGRLLCEERVTVLHQTPSAVRQLLAAGGNEPGWLEALDLLGCGGEALPLDLATELLDRGAPLWNFYGPTEATVWCSAGRVTRAAVESSHVSLGRPLPDTALHVLDPGGRPTLLGVPGQLFLGGERLARGYHGNPARTAVNFVPDPFGDAPGARLYATGDVVRRRSDGSVEFVGRVDHQVKLRGYRIELGEIESVLAEHPSIHQAVVVVARERADDPRLVAHCVCDRPVTEDELRELLVRQLPTYMIPAAFRLLEDIPLTPNGKVDRVALAAVPVPAVDGGLAGGLRNPVEEMVAGIFEEVLGRPGISRSHDFFDLGGHSLLATRAVLRLRAALEVDLAVHELFEAPTVAGLAGRIERALDGERRFRTRAIQPVDPGAGGALSYAQERLWYADQVVPDDPGFNISGGLRLEGELDLGALQRALATIVERHEVLRTRYPEVDGHPVRWLSPVTAAALPLVDLSGVSQARRQEVIERLRRAWARRPFDLARDDLLRAIVVRTGHRLHHLLLTLHHIVADLWSVRILVDELASVYTAATRGAPPPLRPLPIQYADFAQWQRQQVEAGEMSDQLAFWRAQLGGEPKPLEIPTDRARPLTHSFWGAARPFRIPPSLAEELRRLGRAQGATLFMVLLAAIQVLLRQEAQTDDVVVGTNVASRQHLETEGLIGLFINQLVLRTDLSGNPSFADLVRRVRGVVLDAYRNQDLPLDQVVEALRPARKGERSRLYRVKVELENDPPTAPEMPGLTVSLLEVDRSIVRYDLHFYMEWRDGGIDGWLQYKPELYDDSRVGAWVERLSEILEGVSSDPLSDLCALDAQRGEWQRRTELTRRERHRSSLAEGLSTLRRRTDAVRMRSEGIDR